MKEIENTSIVGLELPRDYWFPKSLQKILIVCLILAIAFWVALPPGWEIINPFGLPQFVEFLLAAIQPDLSPEFLKVTWDAAGVTFSYALIGTVLSICFGFVGACIISDVVFGSLFPQWANFGLHRFLRGLLTIPRSLHEVIWGLLLINLVGLDPIAGIMAIAIPYGAIVAKIFAEILDDTPREALDSLLHAGAKPIAAVLFGLLPRAKLSLMSYGFYRFECSLRSAAILGVIGAGGLGYQMMLSLDSLRYEQLWTLFYAIFCLNGLVDLLSAYCRDRVGAPKRFALKNSLQVSRAQQPMRTRFFSELFLLPLVGLFCILAWLNLSPDLSQLWNTLSWSQLIQLQPASSSISLDIWSRLPWLSLQTLSMSIFAIAIAAVGAFILSWFAARSWGRNDIYEEMTVTARIRIFIAHSILLLMRAIPSPIWALVFLYLFRPGIFVGAIALGIHNVGVIGRLFAEDIENADGRGLRSIQCAGGNGLTLQIYGLIPSLRARYVNYSSYRFETCVRESFVLSLVGAGGLGLMLRESLSNFNVLESSVYLILFCVILVAVENINRLVMNSRK